ncbi:uncharacterized [Tachysurus ichikawai]
MLWLADRDSWRGDVPRDISPSSPSASSFTFCHSCPSLAVSNGSAESLPEETAFIRPDNTLLSSQLEGVSGASWKEKKNEKGPQNISLRVHKHSMTTKIHEV